MRIKLYQIDSKKDVNRVRFLDLERTINLSKNVNSSIYRTVFDGEVNCKGWGELFALFNSSRTPITH